MNKQKNNGATEKYVMPLALLVLTLSAFAIGTTEFVVLGLLPDVSRSLSVSIPTAGWLVTGYALGVAIGGPLMAMATIKMPRKKALLMLMAIFTLGNILCAVAANYGYLMVARIITAFCQGAFFGIGAVVAASLVPDKHKGSAVATMFTGLTLANVLGVPLGTWLGQSAGWAMPFWAIAGLGVVSLIGLWKVLPNNLAQEKVDLKSEIRALSNRGMWVALLTTIMFDASMFALFTYVAPMLEQLTKVSHIGVTWSLFLIGLGLTIGNYIGGKLADWHLGRSLTGIGVVLALVSLLLVWTISDLVPAEINLFIWAAVTFASIPGLQVNVMMFGKKAPNLVSTMNIAAFNVGNALGAWVGGAVLNAGYDLKVVPVAAAALALGAVIMMRWSHKFAKRLKHREAAENQLLNNARLAEV